MWVKRMAVEYRTIAAIPAFSSMDVREITPLIDRFTELYKKNGETMETFSYIGKNGFCWINSSAVENLMDHNDYQLAYQDDREFILSLPIVNPEHRQVMLFLLPGSGRHRHQRSADLRGDPNCAVKGNCQSRSDL